MMCRRMKGKKDSHTHTAAKILSYAPRIASAVKYIGSYHTYLTLSYDSNAKIKKYFIQQRKYDTLYGLWWNGCATS